MTCLWSPLALCKGGRFWISPGKLLRSRTNNILSFPGPKIQWKERSSRHFGLSWEQELASGLCSHARTWLPHFRSLHLPTPRDKKKRLLPSGERCLKESKYKSPLFVIWKGLCSPSFSEIVDVTMKPYDLVAVFATIVLWNSDVCGEKRYIWKVRVGLCVLVSGFPGKESGSLARMVTNGKVDTCGQ